MAHIFVADDEPAITVVLRKWFSHSAHQVTIAHDGREALLQGLECLPDLFILDIQMPGLNGIQVAQGLRADPRTAKTPLIALSAQLDYIPAELAKTLFDERIAKPFDLVVLNSIVSRLLRR